MLLFINVGVAITISIEATSEIFDLTQENVGQSGSNEKIKQLQKFILWSTVTLWLATLFEIAIGCFKLGLILIFGILTWPCIIFYYKRT